MGRRRARRHRLHVADGRAVPRHGRREHRAHGAGARQRRSAARRPGGGRDDIVLRLPGGYDTVLGDGGEAFRSAAAAIAIARALIGDPFLVLLDEPSASLDGEGEAALECRESN